MLKPVCNDYCNTWFEISYIGYFLVLQLHVHTRDEQEPPRLDFYLATPTTCTATVDLLEDVVGRLSRGVVASTKRVPKQLRIYLKATADIVGRAYGYGITTVKSVDLLLMSLFDFMLDSPILHAVFDVWFTIALSLMALWSIYFCSATMTGHEGPI